MAEDHSTKTLIYLKEPQPTIQYRDLQGFPGYRIGSDGSVWSCLVHSGRMTDKWTRLAGKTRNGYQSVIICLRGGKRRYAKVSRLVMEAFVGKQPSHVFVRHLNDDPTDNRLENLAYGSAADNAEDARRNGKLLLGEKHGCAKITEDVVRKILDMRREGKSYREIRSITGVCTSTACAIAVGRLWKHVERP